MDGLQEILLHIPQRQMTRVLILLSIVVLYQITMWIIVYNKYKNDPKTQVNLSPWKISIIKK